jgi:hypothetical protein
MIINPSPLLFGIEGSIEIQEYNIQIISNLFIHNVIDKNVYDKMLKIVTKNDIKRNLRST